MHSRKSADLGFQNPKLEDPLASTWKKSRVEIRMRGSRGTLTAYLNHMHIYIYDSRIIYSEELKSIFSKKEKIQHPMHHSHHGPQERRHPSLRPRRLGVRWWLRYKRADGGRSRCVSDEEVKEMSWFGYNPAVEARFVTVEDGERVRSRKARCEYALGDSLEKFPARL